MRIYKDPQAFSIPEPRIAHIAQQLEALLGLVDLECEGRPVEISGFRLRDLSQWTSHRTGNAMNALTPISSVCNSRCQFCFEENVDYARERSLMPVAEAETRLRYFDPETGTSLFPSSRNHMETFSHPRALEIIELARRREPGKLFWITTNGSHFTEAVVERLARLKPIIFKLSLNAADPQVNRDLMKTGRRTETAIEAPRLLQRHGIPFMGGIVAWPTLTLADIEETVRYLEACQAYAIRIRLPLTHRWLNAQLDTDFHRHWQRVSDFARGLRDHVRVPLFVEPPISWVNAIVPEIDGVVQNSPADRAGLKAGDVVRAIEGQPVGTRIHSEALLDSLHLSGRRRVVIQVERDGAPFEAVLEEAEDGADTYPYSFSNFYRGENYGIFHVEDFRLHHLEKALDLVAARGARSVVVFTSAIVRSIAETVLAAVPHFTRRLAGLDLRFETISDNSFGGNYDVMDSRCIADYAAVIARLLGEGRRPDLILVPDAFGGAWGLDVYGRSLADLERRFGIPIERIDWLLVYGREV